MAEDAPPGESEIIRRYFAPLTDDAPGAFSLLDDAAFLAPDPEHGLVLTTDTLVADVHFRAGDRPEYVARKALAVNISDLAAKGAEPLTYLLSLALPIPADPSWLAAFSAGLRQAQEAYDCRLAGGDTVATPGPLTLTVMALGRAGAGGMVPRAGARPGDHLYVTGTIGDAAIGLRLLSDVDLAVRWRLDAAMSEFLRRRYWLPEPRLGAIAALREHASAAMDVSDGLVGDLQKLCLASRVGGSVEAARVPLSDAARAALAADPSLLEALLTGGDDYEILATVPPERTAGFEAACRSDGVAAVCIGRILEAAASLTLSNADGAPMAFDTASYDHFTVSGRPGNPD